MTNNNINTLTFEHHDTYFYYVDDFEKSEAIVELTPTNVEDTDTVTYISREAPLFTNGVNNGLIKFNLYDRFNLNSIGTRIVTMITNDGILMFNFAAQRNTAGFIISDLQTKSLAIYKSGKYANYLNVEIQLDREDNYRILTISY